MSSFNASHDGLEAHAWTITFMGMTGNVDMLIVNTSDLISGDVSIKERVQVWPTIFCASEKVADDGKPS